jgi:uncharacterized repeat protein (TIGR03843 family)
LTDSEGASSSSVTARIERIVALLAKGKIALEGLVPWSSNYTFLAKVRDDEFQALAVYKPSRGERPLWDFPARSLCRREVATYLLSQYLGWPDIPPVVLRKGPHGVGSVQLFVENDLEAHYFTMREQPEYEQAFRHIALFDYVVNNADRKGGHVLKGTQERVWAIDHGLTFHVDYKLRTVIWEYAGERVPEAWLAELQALRAQLDPDDASLPQSLAQLIDAAEIAALRQRLNDLIAKGTFPEPRPEWRNVPYPLV